LSFSRISRIALYGRLCLAGSVFVVCATFSLFLLRFFWCLWLEHNNTEMRLISCVFCWLFILFFAKLLLIILCCCFCAKIVGPEQCLLGAFCTVFAALLLLLMIYEHYYEFRPNLLHVCSLVYFFFTKSLVLIWCHCVFAENCRCRILSVGSVL